MVVTAVAAMPSKQKRRQRLESGDHIAIVGSGLSGLSVALSMEQAGFTNICMYERDACFSARKDGYGLTLTYNPTGILHQLGVLDRIADSDCPSRSHYLFDGAGRIRGYYGNYFSEHRGWGQRGNLRVPRQTVRKILMDRLQSTTIHWNHKLVEAKPVENGEKVQLVFEGNKCVTTDLLVGADGIRSSVIQRGLPKAPPARSLGIRLIIGLSKGFSHPLLQERGFYTLQSGMRLFVMPFACSSSLHPDEPLQYMWQLSFVDSDETPYTAEKLQRQALHRCHDWHPPVTDMIRSTPLDTIWGTVLYDRDPCALYKHMLEQRYHRIVVVGDACHAMSPFKGQGANQALTDGPLVARWYQRASIEAAMKGCMREIVQRTATVVQASRQAAEFWHSGNALEVSHKFAGVCDDAAIPRFLQVLEERSVTAITPDLDASVKAILDELSLRDFTSGKENKDVDPALAVAALEMASKGDLGGLRRLSHSKPALIRSVADVTTGRSCLHAAVQSGHTRTVHWLVTEAGCELDAQDQAGRTPSDLATDHSVKDLLQRMSTEKEKIAFSSTIPTSL